MFKEVDKCFLTKRTINGEYIFDILLGKNKNTDYIYTLAEAHAIDLIATTIAKCEIQVFTKNKETKKIEATKDDTYWRLNLQPNYNENGTMFLYKLVTKLLTNQSALIIINRDIRNSKLLYVADDFTPSSSILYGKIFTDVTISDDDGNSITLNKKYDFENSIYYSLKNSNLQTAKESFKSNSAKMLNAISKSFLKATVPKWRLKTPGRTTNNVRCRNKETNKL